MKSLRAQLEDKNQIVNKLYNKNARLREIIERAKKSMSSVNRNQGAINILNEVDKQ